MPAVIDAVLSWYGKLQVIYIGHSQGTTTLFALLSLKPGYNAKIYIFIALAPVTYFSRNTSLLYRASGTILFQPFLEVCITIEIGCVDLLTH